MNRYFGLHTLEGEWHALLPRYLFLAERVKDLRILDIGCGAGLGASLLLELGASRVDAIDHRPAVVELAKIKHAKAGLDLKVMLWEELDFEPETFDLILCLDPTSPVTDPNLLREVRRVLKPGGEYICAIERTTVHGLETLLPRYGYSHSAEQIERPETISRVPQLGELSRYFKRVFSIIQRPQYGFVFDYAPTEEGSTDAFTTHEVRRRIVEHDQELLAVEPGAPRSPASGPERWITVDKRLCTSEAELAGIELWFCGDEQLNIPRLREVRLPYYSMVERLHKAQPTSSVEGQHTLFEEILDPGDDLDDHATREFTQDEQTGVFVSMPAHSLDDDPTTVRARPSLEQLRAEAAEQAAIERSQLDAYLRQLAALHDRAQADVARQQRDARATFAGLQSGLQQAIERLERLAETAHIHALEQQVVSLTQERDALMAKLASAAPGQDSPGQDSPGQDSPGQSPQGESLQAEASQDLPRQDPPQPNVEPRDASSPQVSDSSASSAPAEVPSPTEDP